MIIPSFFFLILGVILFPVLVKNKIGWIPIFLFLIGLILFFVPLSESIDKGEKMLLEDLFGNRKI